MSTQIEKNKHLGDQLCQLNTHLFAVNDTVDESVRALHATAALAMITQFAVDQTLTIQITAILDEPGERPYLHAALVIDEWRLTDHPDLLNQQAPENIV